MSETEYHYTIIKREVTETGQIDYPVAAGGGNHTYVLQALTKVCQDIHDENQPKPKA